MCTERSPHLLSVVVGNIRLCLNGCERCCPADCTGLRVDFFVTTENRGREREKRGRETGEKCWDKQRGKGGGKTGRRGAG